MGTGSGETATRGVRVGLGYDLHRLVAGGPLRIGGVDIPFGFRCGGHSDGDVLLHAVTDALLGAAALGDIGEMFPDTDPTHRGKDSAEMLRQAWLRVASAGWRIANLDCVVLAQAPRLAPYRDRIRQRLAEILEIPAAQIGVKAKTGEGVDAVGRQEAVAAQCVALLVPQPVEASLD